MTWLEAARARCAEDHRCFPRWCPSCRAETVERVGIAVGGAEWWQCRLCTRDFNIDDEWLAMRRCVALGSRALALLTEAEDLAARLASCEEPFVQSPGLVNAARAFLDSLRTEETP